MISLPRQDSLPWMCFLPEPSQAVPRVASDTPSSTVSFQVLQVLVLQQSPGTTATVRAQAWIGQGVFAEFPRCAEGLISKVTPEALGILRASHTHY